MSFKKNAIYRHLNTRFPVKQNFINIYFYNIYIQQDHNPQIEGVEQPDLDDWVEKANTLGYLYSVRFGDALKYARIHMRLPPFDEK